MQNLPHFPVNITNNDNNQYNVQGIDFNLLKNFFDNNNNIVMQNGNNADGISYMQPKIGNQYYINVPFQQQYMVHMPHTNLVYLNQPHFQNSDGTIQYSTQVLPMQLAPGVVQVDLNDLNKNNQNNNSVNSRSRKRTYNTQIKQENVEDVNQNEAVPCDTKNRPLLYSCTECTRKFSTQSRLSQHMKCHSGIRPFVCGSCDFAFTQKSYLVRHAAVHKEERPYVCELCQKTYKHYGSLANHRKTHRNGKSFVDRSCDNEKNMSMSNIINNNTDENLTDMKTMNSFVSNCSTDFHFQNQQDIQLNDVNQSYTSQYTTDLSTDILPNSSFQSQMSTDNTENFINQLNSQNFYDLIKPESTIAEPKPMEINNFPNSSSDVNNNSSISKDSCQPINLT